MDARTALPEGFVLRFRGGERYTITGELARGGSSIVYNGYYVDSLGERKTVRIKECCPFKCSLIRQSDGTLQIPEAERAMFSEALEKTRQAYRLGSMFFSTDGLTNLTANTYNLFEGNHTLYVVCAYAQGQELSYARYSSVRDSISAVKSAADAIRRIHDQGFLYLDIKPGNILTLEGTTELIQLFDFDTVVPISSTWELGDKISYTRGFAALELQSGDCRHIGRHTDVYGIGALLFYMLFDRVPDAFDCGVDAEYDFSSSKLSGGSYQDALCFRLTEFFHHTLADFYLDRYSDMQTVVEKLAQLLPLADLSARYLLNSRICPPPLFLGRQAETQWLTQKLQTPAEGCIFVAGMGGIGKSSLVRHCLKEMEGHIDFLLFLNDLGSIQQTICDDCGVQINAVRRDRNESDSAYFDRKLGILRELSRGKRGILVIDNYTGDRGNDFSKLMQLGWHVLFVTRDPSLAEGYDTLTVGAMSEDLPLLFAQNMGRGLTAQEQESAASIIRNVGGHTLAVELIARQIGSPVCGLTMEQAAQIVGKRGFSRLGDEQIGYQRDYVRRQDTVKHIIAGLFETQALSEEQRTIMKTLSLFGRTGLPMDVLCDMLRLGSREDLSRLYHQGWISVNDAIITMHPVIEEVVSNWALTKQAHEAAAQVLQFLTVRLRVEAKKEEYPKNLLPYLHEIHRIQKNRPESRTARRLKKQMEDGFAGEVCRARVSSLAVSTDTDRRAVQGWLRLAAAALDGGKRVPEICGLDIYKELLYDIIVNTPCVYDRFLREKCEEFIGLFSGGNERMLLKIYEKLLEILYDHGEFEEAERRIWQARATISGNRSLEIWGRYYYTLAGCYDAVLQGAYDAGTEEEARLLRCLLRSTDKAIHRLTLAKDAGLLLGECLRLKALVLTRSGIGKQKQVRRLLKKVRAQIDRFAQPNSRLVRDYDLTLAWYYTYLEQDYQQTCANLFKAYDITQRISTSELSKIDDQLSPMANIMLEWGEYDQAELFLVRAILACETHREIEAYARRQLELLAHLAEVYTAAGEEEKRRRTMEAIEAREKRAELTYYT